MNSSFTCHCCGTALSETEDFSVCPVCGIDVVVELDSYEGEHESTRRTRGQRRKMNFSKALRKQNLDRKIFPEMKPWYNNLHQYSKNKIHCSCGCCSAKTRNRKKWGRFECWKPSDQRKLDAIKYGMMIEVFYGT